MIASLYVILLRSAEAGSYKNTLADCRPQPPRFPSHIPLFFTPSRTPQLLRPAPRRTLAHHPAPCTIAPMQAALSPRRHSACRIDADRDESDWLSPKFVAPNSWGGVLRSVFSGSVFGHGLPCQYLPSNAPASHGPPLHDPPIHYPLSHWTVPPVSGAPAPLPHTETSSRPGPRRVPPAPLVTPAFREPLPAQVLAA